MSKKNLLLDFVKGIGRNTGSEIIIAKWDMDGTGYHWYMFLVETTKEKILAGGNYPLENVSMSDFIQTMNYISENELSCEMITDTDFNYFLREWEEDAKIAERVLQGIFAEEKND